MKFVIALDNVEVNEMVRNYVCKHLQEKMGVPEDVANRVVASVKYKLSGAYDQEVVGIDVTAAIEDVYTNSSVAKKDKKNA